METSVREDCLNVLANEQEEIRKMVLAGIEQIKEGKTKDFNSVCDRLEKKYTSDI